MLCSWNYGAGPWLHMQQTEIAQQRTKESTLISFVSLAIALAFIVQSLSCHAIQLAVRESPRARRPCCLRMVRCAPTDASKY